MPVEYLLKLREEVLPYVEADPRNVDKLRVLRAAGMVEATLPPPEALQAEARVLCVTGLGCATLRAWRPRPRPQLPATLAVDADDTLE